MNQPEAHRAGAVPRSEIERRISALARSLAEGGVDVALVEHLADRIYFTGSAQDATLIVGADGRTSYLVRKSRPRAFEESPLVGEVHPGRRGLLEALRGRIPRGGRLGLAFDVASAATLRSIEEAIEGLAVIDVSRSIRRLRMTKSTWEIEQLRAAARQVETMFREVPRTIRAGMTELELSGRVEARLRELGHGGSIRVRRAAADVAIAVVVSGASACYPVAFDGPVGGEGPSAFAPAGGSAKPIRHGETVMFDVVSWHNGYHLDTARTFFVGRTAPEPALAAHAFCREVLQQIEARLRPGVRCSEIWNEVVGWIETRGEPEGFMGWGENRVRFLGHGVGLELDEWPVLAERFDEPLASGMVLAVEPKIFTPTIGPVGLENTYVVTPDRPERLTDLPEDLVTLLDA